MKEHWLKLKEWWSNLALREQQAISLCGAVVGIFIVYQFIYSPFVNYVFSLRHQIQTQQKTLLWMQTADKQIEQLEGHAKNKTKSTTPVMLLSFLQKHISHAGLESQLTQLKQASNDSVEMHFQKVEFDKLVHFLTLVIKEQPVSISQLSVIAESTPGIVNADIMLKLAV